MPYEALPSIVDRYNDNKDGADVEVEKGDRITTIEMNSGAFFERGSAILPAVLSAPDLPTLTGWREKFLPFR